MRGTPTGIMGQPSGGSGRRQLTEEGNGDHLDPSLAQQLVPRLMAEVELLQAEVASARRDFARKAARALESRLQAVAAFNRGGVSGLQGRRGPGVLGEAAVSGERVAPAACGLFQ
jgi:hypothetical protein